MLKDDPITKTVIIILMCIGGGVLFFYNPFSHSLKEILIYIFVNPLILFSTMACLMIIGFRVYTEYDRTILRIRFDETDNFLMYNEKKEISILVLTVSGFLGMTCLLSIRNFVDFLYLFIVIIVYIVNIHSFIYIMKFIFRYNNNKLAAFSIVYITMFIFNFILKIPFGKQFGFDILFIYSINFENFLLRSIFQLLICLIINEVFRIVYHKTCERQDVL